MHKYLRIGLAVVALSCLASGTVVGGERAFSWTLAPARGDYIGVRLNQYNLGKYLEQCQLNRPEILAEVKSALDTGKYYRKATKDQRTRPVRVTINVNPKYQLRIVTWRDEPCPECNSAGYKEMPFSKITGSVDVGLVCWKCHGDKVLKDVTTEKYFILSPEDFEDPKLGRRIFGEMAYAGAPNGSEEWVEQLVSKNPVERLAACEWLDKNYVKVGQQFTNIDPMLRKARYHETNDKKRIMVWQFWAGKDLPKARDKAFYRIYANAKTGKITEKGFYPQR